MSSTNGQRGVLPSARGRGGARRGFSGSLTNGPSSSATGEGGGDAPPSGPSGAKRGVQQSGPRRNQALPRGERASEREAYSSTRLPPQGSLVSQPAADEQSTSAQPTSLPQVAESVAATDIEVCNICAEPIDLYSVPPCDHRTCHVCALRLRALYKKKDCTYCKEPIRSLIFTKSPTRTFDSFRLADIPFKDAKLAISFETQEAMDETLIILRFNCPDSSCDMACDGWAKLKSHVRDVHKMILCEYCVKSKKIFAHEHTLYNHKTIKVHVDEEHGLCQFCNEHFYSEDELFVHMRDKHEQCHICKKSDPERFRWQYHRDYKQLEQHFRESHFLCTAKECLADKFVVFENQLDYNAHRVEKHGGELTARERRDIMRVDATFSYADSGGGGRTGVGPSRSRGGHGGRTGRDDHAQASASADEAESVADAAAKQDRTRRTVPGAAPTPAHPPASRRRQFGGALSSTQGETAQSSGAEPAAGLSTGNSVENAALERHTVYMQRVSALLDNSDAKITSFRSAVRTYRASEMGARDLVLTIVALIGGVENATNVVNGLVDLLDQDDKKRDLLEAWNSVRVEKTHFPTLVPSSAVPHTASGASSNRYASFARGHVMNVKHSSARSNHVWSNVERAVAASSGLPPASTSRPRESFPALHASNASSVPGSAAHAQRATTSLAARAGGSAASPWAGNSASAPKQSAAAAIPRPYSVPATSSTTNRASPKTASEALFPSLPVNASALALAQHKKAVLATTATHRARSGNYTSPPSSGAATPTGSGQSTPLGQWGAGDSATSGGAGNKGKGKKKGVPLLSMGGVQRG